MNLYSTSAGLREALVLSGTVRHDGGVVVTNPERFRAEVVDSLVWTAVFGPAGARDAARRAIREAAESLGILPASILPLYQARGRGEFSGFTVPAINVRMMSSFSCRPACELKISWSSSGGLPSSVFNAFQCASAAHSV